MILLVEALMEAFFFLTTFRVVAVLAGRLTREELAEVGSKMCGRACVGGALQSKNAGAFGSRAGLLEGESTQESREKMEGRKQGFFKGFDILSPAGVWEKKGM